MGSRVKRLGSHIDRRASRHVLGRVFASARSAMLGVAVYDSQCGAKIFRAELVPVLFEDPFLTRWLFDLEMLVRLRNGLAAAVVRSDDFEVPLARWREVGGSKLKLSDMISVPLELLRSGRTTTGDPESDCAAATACHERSGGDRSAIRIQTERARAAQAATGWPHPSSLTADRPVR